MNPGRSSFHRCRRCELFRRESPRTVLQSTRNMKIVWMSCVKIKFVHQNFCFLVMRPTVIVCTIWLACFSISSFFTPLNWLWCRLPRRLRIFFRAIGTGALLFSSIDAIRGTCFFVGSVDDFPKDQGRLLPLLFLPPLHKRLRDNELMWSPVSMSSQIVESQIEFLWISENKFNRKLSIVAKIHHRWSIFNFSFLQDFARQFFLSTAMLVSGNVGRWQFWMKTTIFRI